jgi:glycosyltransferase involved in cell wall biosynthesis
LTADVTITIISAVYPPEPQVSARMSYDLARYLASQGYYVTVLCPKPSRPLSADYSQYMNTNKAVETCENGVKIVRLPSFVAPKARLLLRMWESFSFGYMVIKYLATVQKRPDVLYVNSWPMFAQALIARFSKIKGIPMVLQIMDTYPEALTSKLPAFLRSVIHLPLMRLDTWIARASVKVVVISENMRRTYTESRKLPVKSVVTIPTWQDEAVFENPLPRSECCSRYRIPLHSFTFLFLGNIGPVAGVDLLIHAFAEAKIPDAQLLIVGDGSAKSDCVKLVKQFKLSHVYFISDPESANVPILQSMAHVCMLPMKRGAGMSSIPSKLPSYLFSAKPVIATVDRNSDTARFVREAECGWVGDAEDLDWLVKTMLNVSCLSSNKLDVMGESGKRYGLSHFSKSTCVVRLADLIIKASGVNV